MLVFLCLCECYFVFFCVSVSLFVLVFLCWCECFFVCSLFVYLWLFFLCMSVFCLREKEEAVSGAREEAYHLRKRDG